MPVWSNKDCSNFLSFFVDKIRGVRASIIPSFLPLSTQAFRPSILDSFSPISMQELTDLVRSMRSSSSPVDILPTSVLKNALECIGPCLVSIINSSLQSGCVPAYFKHAVVQPLLKKTNLDPYSPNNYRPISKLPFISKILEKVVAKQLTAVLTAHNIFDKFQSGFRQKHSTETALLRVSNDIMMSSDVGECSVLVLLDLSAAFDTVDHRIMTERLRQYVGVSGSALDWFSSYLTDRSFSVSLGPYTSESASLSCGVPQGSVLGPILFALYMLPLGQVISKFSDVSYHCYADDIQLYVSFKPDNPDKLSVLHNCLTAIKDWMSNNYLQLNTDKTEVLIIASDSIAPKVAKSIGSLSSAVRSNLRNLGVIFDQAMHFDQHIKSLTRTCFFHLRNIAKLKSIVSQPELEMIIHAFISSRLDYCNSIFTCLSKASLNRLQMVQNAAARLLTRSSRMTHITPILRSLHWLPICFRIHFKVLAITYRALHGQAPEYIMDLIHPYVASRSLRSSNQDLLAVPRSRLKTKGDRAFAFVAPTLWNSLPAHIRSAVSIEAFKKQLKTHLFKLAFVSF